MSTKPRFGFKVPDNQLEDYKNSYVRVYVGNNLIYGFLKNITQTDIVLMEVPEVKHTNHGLESFINEKPTLISLSNIAAISGSSRKEIEARKDDLIPFEIFMGKLVIARDGNLNYYGVLARIFYEFGIGLLPSLTPRFDEYGLTLIWNKETPLYVRNVVEIAPITMEDLENLIKNIELEHSLNKKQKVLALKRLELEERQLKKALEEQQSSQ